MDEAIAGTLASGGTMKDALAAVLAAKRESILQSGWSRKKGIFLRYGAQKVVDAYSQRVHALRKAEGCAVCGLHCNLDARRAILEENVWKLPSNSGNSSLLRCSSCRSTFYCSSKCQRIDWKSRHKTICPSLTLAAVDTEFCVTPLAASLHEAWLGVVLCILDRVLDGRFSAAHEDQSGALEGVDRHCLLLGNAVRSFGDLFDLLLGHIQGTPDTEDPSPATKFGFTVPRGNGQRGGDGSPRQWNVAVEGDRPTELLKPFTPKLLGPAALRFISQRFHLSLTTALAAMRMLPAASSARSGNGVFRLHVIGASTAAECQFTTGTFGSLIAILPQCTNTLDCTLEVTLVGPECTGYDTGFTSEHSQSLSEIVASAEGQLCAYENGGEIGIRFRRDLASAVAGKGFNASIPVFEEASSAMKGKLSEGKRSGGLCPNFLARLSSRLRILTRKSTYHNFYAVETKAGTWKAPDLVMIFNSGIHQTFLIDGKSQGETTLLRGLWPKTVKVLISQGFPTVLTCYSKEEAALGEAALRSMWEQERQFECGMKKQGPVRVVFGPEPNPFRSLEVKAGTSARELNQCYHESAWWFGVRGTSEQDDDNSTIAGDESK